MYDVIIIGGGLAGLTNALLLASKGKNVLVLEKNRYPFHKVCGEYVSNEVKPFLKEQGIYPFNVDAPDIKRLKLTTQSGNVISMPLDLGGFGISRYNLDYQFYHKVLENGAHVLTDTKVNDVQYLNDNDHFSIHTHDDTTYRAKVVIGNFGKLSVLDRRLNRQFLQKPSPYIGVKYHVSTDAPVDEVALHNFPNGYCGLSKIEEDKYCLCYLANRNDLKKAGSIPKLEKDLLSKNPLLKQVFHESKFHWNKPLVINEISFSGKTLVENHVLTSGDASGMITPLCGNGMAMAIHSGKILSPIVDAFLRGTISREQMEKIYIRDWERHFQERMKTGRKLQDRWFGHYQLSELAVEFFKLFPWLGRRVVMQTHGKPF